MLFFFAQRALGNEKATEELENAYVEIMTSQRSFDMGRDYSLTESQAHMQWKDSATVLENVRLKKTNIGHRRRLIQRNCLSLCRK